MSKFGLKIGDKTIYGVKNADQAIDLIETVVKQFLGGSWTQYEPKCPICDEKLKDFQKHMNRPIGECVNEKCQSTIFPSDYIGKIMDIITEIHILREEAEVAKKQKAQTSFVHKAELYDTDDVMSEGGEETISSTVKPESSKTVSSVETTKSGEEANPEGDITSKKLYAGLPVIDW